MRDTIFTSLFLASATLTSASRLECLHTRSEELASVASCGDKGSLNYCFSNLPIATQPEALSGELERCFNSAGCTPAESQIEAYWVQKRCETPTNDLRRGRRQPDNEDSLAAAAKEPLMAARNPMPAITAMVVPRQTTAATTAATTNPASPSPCFSDTTSSITSCPLQTTGTDAGKKLSCFPTVLTSAVCRDGLICTSDKQGNPSCMYKHSSLGVDGTIIAIIFASAIVISIVSICFLCCRERREHKRIERAAEAARIAKEAKTATATAKRPGTSITGMGGSPVVEGQPLMNQGPPSPGLQGQQGGYGAANPFADGSSDGGRR
ncbi:uncharacterized protein B0T15DRAFT_141276 [Chaetomium strumarium]|uniref:Extracellular membrane protein CFEM domain-containing protein n=1 Tax=Chaetomium strumarium TaxID=1170767 RepID=A0AAJ0GV78_9PEZI|nr:hypothetical protein B0T15DRAFT_141276 [Chaetomium strumarium]